MIDLDALAREARGGKASDAVPVTRRWLQQAHTELREAEALRRQLKMTAAIDAVVSSGAPA